MTPSPKFRTFAMTVFWPGYDPVCVEYKAKRTVVLLSRTHYPAGVQQMNTKDSDASVTKTIPIIAEHNATNVGCVSKSHDADVPLTMVI